jgi:hypothetical protein
MKLLLDEHITPQLRLELVGHDVYTVQYMNWRSTVNGLLLAKAAENGFYALITNDGGIYYEQNQATLPCSVVYLDAETNAPESVLPLAPKLLRALETLPPRSYLNLSDFE